MSLRVGRPSRRIPLFLVLGATASMGIASAYAHPESLVDITSLWADPRVSVCFATSQTKVNAKADIAKDVKHIRNVYDHSPYEARIQTILEREYTAERTGLSFRDFGNCDRVPENEPNAPAFIFADTDAKDFGLTSIGDESKLLPAAERVGLISGSILDLRSVKANKDYSVARAAKALVKITGPGTTADQIVNLQADIDDELAQELRDVTVLHEMGHLAGLLHEERRTDAATKQPSWCRSADDQKSQDPKTEKTYGTEFDPFSIMDYCTDDLAKGFAFYHILCQFPKVSAALAEKDSKFNWNEMAPYCDFMMKRDYPARLSARDRATLRRVYLGVDIPPGSRSFRTNPEEVMAFKALGALYDALPDSMELGDEITGFRPSR